MINVVAKPDDHEITCACCCIFPCACGAGEAGRIGDLRPYFESVPGPRSRRGRWYPLPAILLVRACGVVSCAKITDGLAEWGQHASATLLAVIGIRVYLLGWRRTPSSATIGRVLKSC